MNAPAPTLRTGAPLYRGAVVVVLLIALVLTASAPLRSSGAQLVDSATVPGNTVTLDVLDPPQNLSANGGFTITLSWSPSPDPYVAGYRIFRRNLPNGSYTQIAQVGPGVTSYVDNPTILFNRYGYMVRAYYQQWQSVDSNSASCNGILVLFLC